MAGDDDDDRDERRVPQQFLQRNLIAFWILGLCNNFAYVVMLSAAKDILGESGGSGNGTDDSGKCIEKPEDITCSKISTGAVLLADIIPSLVVKLLSPFLLQSISYSVRHAFVMFFQTSSFLMVAFSRDFSTSLLGVVFASAGSGLGEVSYLSLSSHFPSEVISSWSSGTGGAGIVGALAFAAMTDHRLLALSPRSAMLLMLIVPFILFYTFWRVLEFPATVHRVNFWRPATFWIPPEGRRLSQDRVSISSASVAVADSSQADSVIYAEAEIGSETPLLSSPTIGYYVSDGSPPNALNEGMKAYLRSRLRIIRPLVKYMLPLFIVYYAEYFINQGLLELLTFTCAQSFNFSPASQYRWYQVLYQVGVFISRSSVKFLPLHPICMPVLSILQVINATILFNKAMHPATGHIIFIFLVVFYEGLLGGAAYVNTFNIVHKTVKFHREFSMGFVALSDTLGIVFAGFSGIWAHNYICTKSKYFSQVF